jgi:hypothetical protein
MPSFLISRFGKNRLSAFLFLNTNLHQTFRDYSGKPLLLMGFITILYVVFT